MSEPYYRDEFVTLYHGDCREIDLPAVDLVLTDPPYGMALDTDFSGMNGWSGKGHRYAPIVGDGERFDPAHLLGLGRVQVLWGAQYFCHSRFTWNLEPQFAHWLNRLGVACFTPGPRWLAL